MIVVQNRIFVAKGYEDEFEKRFINRDWSVSRLPGFVRNEVLKPSKDFPDAPYIVKTYWATMEDFERWTKSKEFGMAHANAPPKEAFRAGNSLEIHEILAVHEKPASAPKGEGTR